MHFLHPTGLLKISIESNWVQKTKTSVYEIPRIDFAHFPSFNFAKFDIGESFGLIWVKLQNG